MPLAFLTSIESVYLSVGKSACMWLRRPPSQWKPPGSNPACDGIFPGSSHINDFKIGTSVVSLPGAWRYRVSAGTGWPGVSIPLLGEVESLDMLLLAQCGSTYNCLSRSVPEIHVAGTLSNKQTNCMCVLISLSVRHCPRSPCLFQALFLFLSISLSILCILLKLCFCVCPSLLSEFVSVCLLVPFFTCPSIYMSVAFTVMFTSLCLSVFIYLSAPPLPPPPPYPSLSLPFSCSHALFCSLLIHLCAANLKFLYHVLPRDSSVYRRKTLYVKLGMSTN